MPWNKKAIAAIVLMTLPGLCAQALAGDDRKAVDRVRMEFNAASRSSDAEALASLLDRDAVWMPPGREPIVGREAVEDYYTQRFRDKRSEIRLHPGTIQWMGNWAVLHSTFSRTDVEISDRTEQVVSGNYMWVLRKQPDNTWKVARDVWNEISETVLLSDALARVDLFAGLTPAERDILKPAATLRRVEAGARITTEGESPGKMFIVLDGQADVLRQGNRVTTLSGQFIIGETEFLNQLPMFVDVVLREETELLILDNNVLTGLLRRHPRIGYEIMHALAVVEAIRLRETTIGVFSSKP